MNSLQTNKAPNSNIVIPHFIFGAFSLLVLAVLIIFAESELLAAYFNNKLIAITHLAVLGWGTMIIFGALYQLIPVVFEASLYSEKLAKITFWANSFSVAFLCYAFWVGSFTNLLVYAATCMFISLFLFVVNVLLTYQKAQLKNIKSKLIIASIFWLAITEFLGTLIAYNFKFNFLSQIHLNYLKIHATIGFVGWFLLLIIGVGSTLIPMFLVSHHLKENKLKYAYGSINFGLILILINGFISNSSWIYYLATITIAFGLLSFMSYLYDSYKKRLRKKLDIGLKYSAISILLAFIPLVIIAFIFYNKIENYNQLYRITTFYGFTIIFGFITTLILGQTYKTLPFIVWLKKYQHLVGKTKTPLPRELYGENIANFQFILYLIFLITISIGLLFNSLLFIKFGSYALLILAILYNYNIFKIILHKPKIIENE